MLELRKPCSQIAACLPRSLTSRLVSGCFLSPFSVFYSVLHPPFLRCAFPLVVFSDRFSEGAPKNLRDGFPPNEEPYTDSYECSPDSDLDDEEGETEAGEPSSNNAAMSPTRKKGTAAPDRESARARRVPSLVGGRNNIERATATAGNSGDHHGTAHVQLGKVAIIRDVAATT